MKNLDKDSVFYSTRLLRLPNLTGRKPTLKLIYANYAKNFAEI